MAVNVHKCPPDDPHRCQFVTKHGQCPNLAANLPDGGFTNNCLIHGGRRQQQSVEKKALRIYHLGRYQDQLQKQVDNTNIKSLREEIGLLRIAMQIRWDSIRSDTELLLQSGAISELVMKIEKLVTSCHKLEGSMKLLVDKAAIIQFAAEVIQIIGDELVGQEDVIEKIANKILGGLGDVGETDDEE